MVKENQNPKKRNKKTVGQASQELLAKHTEPVLIKDQGLAMTKGYMDELIDCAEKNLSQFAKDFYIAVLTKKERVFQNVIRNYFVARQTCPTPSFDQSVFKVKKEAQQLQYLWTVPSKETCEYLQYNRLLVDPEEHELLTYVMQFSSGQLDKLAQKENNELTLTH